jgi:hypothetical protein
MVWCESWHVCNGRCVCDQPTPFIDEPASDPVLLRTLAAAGLPATDLFRAIARHPRRATRVLLG